MTYLAGVSSIGGALLAGCIAQAGLLTALGGGSGAGDGPVDRYRFAISGIALIVMAIVAPEGVTGLVRRLVGRLRSSPPPAMVAGEGRSPAGRPTAVEATS
jgi:hypothetical protein